MFILNQKLTVLIPSRDEASVKRSSSADFFPKWAGTWKVGYPSIFDAVESEVFNPMALKENKDDDILVLMHDDVNILSSDSVFEYFLSPLKDKGTGFVGVAGTQYFTPRAVWWEGLNETSPVMRGSLAGTVNHGDSLETMTRTVFGHGNKTQVVVMDGLILAATYRTWKSIRLAKPKEFSGNWDFYDMYYTFQAHMKGLKNYVMPLEVLHKSPGDTRGKEGWHKNKEAFLSKYRKHLPQSTISCNQ